MKRIVCLLLAAAATASVHAQQQPTFKSRVHVVEVDARVFDKDGRFVRNLTKDDFEVLENGVPQTVDATYLIVAPPADGRPQLFLPGAAENRDAGVPAAPQTWIFVFDLNHLAPGTGFERARTAVEDFISKRFRDGDLAGVVAGDKMVNNRLTSVRSEMVDAVKKVKPINDVRGRVTQLTRAWPRFLDEEEALRVARNERDVVDRVVGRACSDDPTYCERDPRAPEAEIMSKGRMAQQEMLRNTSGTLSALNALASGLARMPGPKTVVFLSAGFVSMDVEASVRTVVGQIARAGGRVYSIDVRGLDRAGGSGIIDQGFTEDPYGAVPKFDMGADGSNSLAIDTGGMMIRNENNLGRALDRIAEDGGTYYVIAYQPADSNFDGAFRRTEVKVKRPGLVVRARRGYLALDPAKMLKPHAITRSGPAATPIGTIPRDTFEVPAVSLSPVPPPADPSVPATTGAVVVTPETPREPGSMRLRPDSEGRVKALSAREPAKANEWITRGWDAYQRGDVETALANFTEAASRGDVPPWALYALGMSQAAMGRTSEAISSWQRVKDAAPDFEPVYMDLADAFAQIGDLTRSLAALREAETHFPKSGDVQSAIGVIHVRRGAMDEGIEALAKAAALKPDDPLAFLNLGRAYELRFHRGRRYVTSQRRWVAPEEDRVKAREAYERCVKLGGPYAERAAEALSILAWSKT